MHQFVLDSCEGSLQCLMESEETKPLLRYKINWLSLNVTRIINVPDKDLDQVRTSLTHQVAAKNSQNWNN